MKGSHQSWSCDDKSLTDFGMITGLIRYLVWQFVVEK